MVVNSKNNDAGITGGAGTRAGCSPVWQNQDDVPVALKGE